MNKLLAILLLGTALVAPEVALAKSVTVTTSLIKYSGHHAYLAVYITNPDGSYNSTLWVAGTKFRYLGHLRQWAQGISKAGGNIDGITGASVGSGRTLKVTSDIADALIDAGYQIHVDSASEDGFEVPSDAVIPLESSASPVSGSGYVKTLSISM
jgi:hypothetical protein